LSDAPKRPPTEPPPPPRPQYKRRLSNYLLDKKLQLRYVLFVTLLSAIIAGALGYLIYVQRHSASTSIESDLTEQFNTELQGISNKLDAEDRMLIYKMIGVGFGLVIILSMYLTIMTHKVAGPLYKVSMYFDKMADGKLGRVTPLRQGDMLVDFYQSFSDMHHAVRARAQADADRLGELAGQLRATSNEADYRGEARSQLNEELDKLTAYVDKRKQNLG
jgi:hypothetical protein